MSNPSPNDRPSANSNHPLRNLLNRLKSPSTLIIGGSAIAVLVVGYTGAKLFIEKNLPNWLETTLSETLNRPVEIGEVNNLSLTHIEIHDITIPPTSTDSDNISLETIEADFNLLPLLFGKPLPATVNIIGLDAYLEQDEQGKWVDLNLPETENQDKYRQLLPIDADIKVELENTNISLLPQGQTQPLTAAIEGTARYLQNEQQQISYDINTQFSNANILAEGETIIDTGHTELDLSIQNLVLPELVSLIPNSPLEVSSGELNADLNLQLPSFEEITDTQAQGKINFEDIAVTNAQLKQPLLANALIDFQGDKILVEQGKVSLGNLQAQLGGTVDWQQGYNLNLDVPTFNIAPLLDTISLSLPITLEGVAQANLDITGQILDPVVKGTLSSDNLLVEKTEFENIVAEIKASLAQVELEKVVIKPEAGGEIIASGEVQTNIKKLLEENQPIDIRRMPLQISINAELPTQDLIEPYYPLPEPIQIGIINATGNVQGTLENPEGKFTWVAPAPSPAPINNINGGGEVIFANQIISLNNTQLNILNGEVEVDGNVNLKNQKWQTLITANDIPLNRLLPTIANIDTSRPVVLENANLRLSGELDKLNIDQVNALANLALNVDSGTVVTTGRLNSGQVDVNAKVSQVPLNQLLPTLPLPANIIATDLNLSGDVQQLLSWSQEPNLSTFTGDADFRLGVSQGIVNGNAQLNNNQWQSNIVATEVNISPLLNTDDILPNVNANVDLSGDIETVLSAEPEANIQVNNVQVNMGEQFLEAQGNILLSELNTNPDIARLDLDIQASSDLDTLPINELLDSLPEEQVLLPVAINLTGDANFTGKIQGQNLISAPLEPGNLNLTANLNLLDFSLNDREFDPQLSGPIKVDLGQEIDINLQGNQDDVIAANLVACESPNCRLPYLPNSLALKQGTATETGIAVSGNRQGTSFQAEVTKFPLDILNIAPLNRFSIPGVIQGDVQADLDVDLFTFATEGNLTINRPGVGYVEANQVTMEFTYDVDQEFAELVAATLTFGEKTEYNLQGAINLNTGEVDATAKVEQGTLQDIFTTLRWSSIEDINRIFNPPEYGTAKDIPTNPVGNPQATVAEKVNLLWKIEQQIREIAEKNRGGGVPQLDFRGDYTGEVNVDGTLTNPEIAFQLDGNDWQWRPQPATLNVVDELGLVQEKNATIPIPKVLIKGSFAAGDLNLNKFLLNMREMIVSLQGNLSNQSQLTNFKVENLTVDLIDNIINIPADIAATINIEGELAGSLNNPQLQANINVDDAAFNGRILGKPIEANIRYDDARLDFATTAPESLLVSANIPYPPQSENEDNMANINVKIDTAILSLIGSLTEGQIEWIDGTGEVTLQAVFPLTKELNPEAIVRELVATGQVSLDNATILSGALKKAVSVTGKINLNNQVVEVETLNANLDEADIKIVGALPLLRPINNLNNPLTLIIEPGNVEIPDLYEGQLDGTIKITGAALEPVIAGEVSLTQGRAFAPNRGDSNGDSTALANEWLGTDENNTVAVKLENFKVNINGLSIRQFPLYSFRVIGDLTLNGTIDNLKNIEANGILELQRADVNILETSFALVPSYLSTIEFIPTLGLLNPYLDIQMRTSVNDLTGQNLSVSNSNEVIDDTLRSNRANRVNIFLAIDGRASQIIPTLSRDTGNLCQIYADSQPPIPPDGEDITQEQLDTLTNCVELNAFNDQENSDLALIQGSAVNLSSSPSRSDSQIIELLAGQFINLGEQLTQGNTADLLRLGVDSFLLGPILNDVLFSVEQEVVSWFSGGEQQKSKDIQQNITFQIYPVIDTTYNLNRDSSVKGVYDYIFNEVQVLYQIRF